MPNPSVSNTHPNPRKASVLDAYRKTVTVAFRQDCESFFKKFETFKSFSYDSFAATWELLDFTYIYADQTYVSTLRILCETCFQTLKILMLKPSCSLYTRVAALYILYGLYYKQPVKGMVKIRIVMDEYKALTKLLEIMKLQGCYDPLYCFVKLKTDGAFLFVAHQKFLKLENHKPATDCVTYDGLHMKDSEGSLYKFENLMNDPVIEDLENTCKEYDEKMKKYAEKCPSLAPFQTSVISEFRKAFDNVLHVDLSELAPKKTKPTEMSIHRKRQSIRKRAMKNKKGVYRGAKKVLTKIKLEEELLFCKMEEPKADSDFHSSSDSE